MDRYTLGEHVSGIVGAMVEAWMADGRIQMRMEQGPLLKPHPIDRADLRNIVIQCSYRIAAHRVVEGKKYLVFGHTHPVMQGFILVGSERGQPSSRFAYVTNSRDGVGTPGSSVLMEFDERIVAPAILLP